MLQIGVLFFFFSNSFCVVVVVVMGLELGKLFLELARRRGLERLFVVLVEIASVALFALGRERRLDFLLIDGYPIGSGEPFVIFDVVDAVL